MGTLELLLTLLPWLLANIALLIPTTLLWRRLRLRSPGVDALVFLFLFFFSATALVMVLALLGLLRPISVLVTTLGAATISGRLGQRELRAVATFVLRRARAARVALPTLRWSDWALVAVWTAIASRILIHVWLLPPYVRDTLSYHLPKVAEWVQSGSLDIFPTPIDRTFWPGGFELFQTWFVLFPHHDFLIEMACVAAYVFACGAVFAAGRCLGLSSRGSLLAATIYGLTPAPLQHASSNKNDLAIAALFLFLLVLFLDALRGRLLLGRRALLAALAMVLAVGTKPTIVFLAPGLVVAVFWVFRQRLVEGPTRTVRDAGAGPGKVLAAGLLSVAGLLAGYWFLRNALVFGNPFYPAEPRLFGDYLFGSAEGGRERQGVVFSAEALLRNLQDVLTVRIFDRNAFHFSQTDMTSWGWFAFVCGWPALAAGLLGSPRLRWLAAVFGVSLLGLLSSVVSDPWYMRFAQWFPALFSLAFCLVLSRLRWRLARIGLWTLASACLSLNFIGSLDIGGLAPDTWQRMARLPVAERSSATLGLFFGPRFHLVVQRVPSAEPIGYNTNYNGFVYPLYDADYSRDVRYVPLTAESPVAATLRDLGVRWLFVSLPSTLR